jgi:ATP-dependent DNA helicase DinG
MCSRRGFCKLIKAREHYRLATDLIIADHAVFFQDLWTREERIADRKIPLLPSYSAVVFDEGHKVILPSAMEAGQYLNQEEINHIIFSIEQIQGARKSLISMALELEKSSADFFKKINHCVIKDESSERLPIRIEDYLFEAASTLYKDLDRLLLEMQIEQELYIESLPENMVQAYEAQIERSMRALNRFFKNKSKDVITWMNQKDNSFWVVPRNLSDKLNKYLFQKDLSVVFTSATLSNDGDFSYFSRTLGLKKPSTSTVGSAFDYEEQVVVYLSNLSVEKDEDLRFEQAYKKLLNLLKLNEGRALVLTNSLEEVRKIRDKLKEYQFPFEILWEDQGDRGYLVQKFREEVSTVLIGANFWEGIDVPGEALTLLVIWQLPFPSLDPLIEVQRKEAMVEGLDPVVTVDYPEMGLKLKQGCGRLIRTKDDKGAIYIMDAVVGEPWENVVMGAIPHGAKVFFD